MTKQKVGLVIFWIAVIGAFLSAVIVAMVKSPVLHTLTLEELNQTIWAPVGPMNILWGQVTPLLALVAGIGILLYFRHKRIDGMEVWNRDIPSVYYSLWDHVPWTFPSVVHYWGNLDFTVGHRDTMVNG